MQERTLVLIKPDAVYNKWEAPILQRYVEAGFKVIHTERMKLQHTQAHQFYGAHAGKFYYAGLILAMVSSNMVAVLLEGENAIEAVRTLNGATNPQEAAAGTIRKDFLSAGGPFNTVHSSDSAAAAKREIELISSWSYIFKRVVEKSIETGSS